MSTHHFSALVGLLIAGALVTTTYAHLGSCEDHAPSCRIWAARGFCQSNLEFMASNCPVSCDLCLDPGCFDRNHHCSDYAAAGLCRSHRVQLERTCPHSCNFCQIPLGDFTNAKSLATPDFDCGRPVGGASNSKSGRRVARQIIFPDELEEYIRNRKLQRGTMALMRTGSSDTAVPISDSSDTAVPISDSSDTAVPISNLNVTDAFCGATLIHEKFLITAAHCVLDPDRPVRTVRLGELDFSRENEANSNPADYEVERIIVHPDFKPNSPDRYNDIALIQTVEKVQFNEVVYPFCIPSVRPSTKAVVTGSGFGFVNNTDRSNILQEAELEIVDARECENIYQQLGFGDELKFRYPELLRGKDVLCASFPGRDACMGDSGGPLFLDESGRRFLVGVVGSGISCRGNGISPLPGFYVSIADHIDFINRVVYPQ